MKKSKKILISILVLITGIISAFTVVNCKIVKEANSLPIKEIHPEKMKDGTYYGNYELSPVKVTLNVKIKEGEIKAIEVIEHSNGIGKDAEKIIHSIIKKQSLSVDSVSGATVSSVCFKKAVEDALK